MRDRKEIESELSAFNANTYSRIQMEILLDIRELLKYIADCQPFFPFNRTTEIIDNSETVEDKTKKSSTNGGIT